MTYGFEDRPESTRIEDLVAFWRAARDETRTVVFESAGVAASQLAWMAACAAVKLSDWGRDCRGRADELAPSLPVPRYWQQQEPKVSQDDDLLHDQAERAATMSRHPAGKDGL